MMLAANSVLAAEIVHKITATTSSSNKAKIPMTISSDSKIVRESLDNYKASQDKASNAVTSKVVPGAVKNGQLNKNVFPKERKPEPIIIHLDAPEDQPPVVNKTERFVFRDITARGADVIAQPDNLIERTKKIELLRRQSAVKR